MMVGPRAGKFIALLFIAAIVAAEAFFIAWAKAH